MSCENTITTILSAPDADASAELLRHFIAVHFADFAANYNETTAPITPTVETRLLADLRVEITSTLPCGYSVRTVRALDPPPPIDEVTRRRLKREVEQRLAEFAAASDEMEILERAADFTWARIRCADRLARHVELLVDPGNRYRPVTGDGS